MLSSTVLVQGYMIENLYINRAKFAVFVVNGISLPFFNNLIAKLKR
ncbi:RAxF-45 family protein [Bacillus sp. B1-b2]|nr:RAxF-45 family protein [Bacillus sp. B1-b2]